MACNRFYWEEFLIFFINDIILIALFPLNFIHLQHFVAIVVGDLDDDFASFWLVERAADGGVEAASCCFVLTPVENDGGQ